MDPQLTDLHAGLSGISLIPESFDLGSGIVLRQTYAHFMAPFLMAFAPATPGKPHPAPWKSAHGGLSIDIAAELSVPMSYHPPHLDRLNTIWWIVALLRLKAGTGVFAPVISTERFASIPSIADEPELLPMEVHLKKLSPNGGADCRVDVNELEWLRSHWEPSSELLGDQNFSTAFLAIDSCIWNPDPAIALLVIWGAIERLFSTSHQELSFRVSANLATFLEPPGRPRFSRFKQIKNLYDSRSRVAHGSGIPDARPFVETYGLARGALLKMIESLHVPTKDELEGALFGDQVAVLQNAVKEQ